MNDMRVARRNLRQYRGRIISLALAVVFGSVVSLVCIELVARAADAAQQTINESVALRTVEIQDQPDRIELKPLRGSNVTALSSVPHVTAVEPWVQAGFGIKTLQIGGALLYATPVRASTLPPIVKSTRTNPFPLRDGEVVLPALSQGEKLDALLGQKVPVTYTRKISEGQGEAASDQVTVVAVYDPTYALDGPAAAYADPAMVIRWAAARAGIPAEDFVATVGYSKVFTIVDESTNVTGVVAALRADGYNAVSLQERLTALPVGLRLLRTLGIGVFVVLLVYGALAGAAISSSFMRSRTREIGLLNALGFRQQRILRILLLELALVGAAAGLLGAALGAGISIAAEAGLGGRNLLGVDLPAGVSWPNWFWTVLLLLAPALTVTVGGLLPARRVARLQPDLALRDLG